MSIARRARLARAQTVIDAYSRLQRYDVHDETLIDILADLMHWSDALDLDFERALRHAEAHHDAEMQP